MLQVRHGTQHRFDRRRRGRHRRNTLTTRPLVAKNPSVMSGPPANREFKIDGNMLTFVQKSAAGQPVSQTTTRLTRIE